MKDKSITIYAPAKANLFLEVVDKRDDGYHNIISVMQSISLCDKISVEISKGQGISVNTINNAVLSGPKNLSFKAAEAFLKTISYERNHIHINITKNIPISSGLGGGSTDAASTLLALNTLYDCPLSCNDLSSLGAAIGADVPFCLRNGTALVYGVGEKVMQCDVLPECYIVILIHGKKESTKQAYALLDQCDSIKQRKRNSEQEIMSAINHHDIREIGKSLYNAFEIITPIEKNVRNIFLKNHTMGLVLSGSGPAIIGLFITKENAVHTIEDLSKHNYTAFLSMPYRR